MPEKNIPTESKMSSNKCSCCPYGFHIDRDFVRYCDSLYNSAQLDKLRQHKRERRKEKKSVESYLGLANLSLERNKNKTAVIHQTPVTHQNLIHSSSEKFSKEFYLQNDDLKNAVNDFEDTWKKSLTKSFSSHVIDFRNGVKRSDSHIPLPSAAHGGSLSSVNSEDMRENKLSSLHVSRSSSTSSVSSQSTTPSHIVLPPISDDSCNSLVSGFNSSLSSLSKPLSNVPHQTVGINKSVLTNIREQMASSLHRMKELEDQVKSIPVLKVKISTLSEEKKSLMNELKVKENISEVKNSKGENDLEKQLKKLENEGIMSPTLSKKCLSLRHSKSDSLFSPAIASSLDATMIKKSFIENEIISHLKMNDTDLVKLKFRKSVGTSCNVLTRDIGVGYIPNKYKSIAVGNDFSPNDCLSLFKRGHFEKQTSVSSGSLESDLDSLSGTGDIPRFSSDYHLKYLSLNETSLKNIPLQKNFVDTSTNTESNYIDKCVNTEKEYSFISQKSISPEKSVRHKSVSASPSMNNKYIQVSNKYAFKHVGLQTSEGKIKGAHLSLPYTRDVGVGDSGITDVVCDNCKKCKKSVGIGDSDIHSIICKKCHFETISTSFVSVSVGDFDINMLSCKSCQENILKDKNLIFNSTGTNTTSDLCLLKRNIYICDKCSETIHSVAQDLVADYKEASVSEINTNISKIQTSKSKISKLKPYIKPLNIGESNSSVQNITLFKETRHEKKISISGRHKSENIEQKDNETLNRDTDCTMVTSFSTESLPNFTNLPHLPRKKNELAKEISAACKVLNDHLQKADRTNEKKMLSSLNIIQTEWFKAANQKKADPHLIEDYIDAFEEFSELLLHKIVNLSDSNGNTALHYAVSYGNFDVVSILIDSKVCDVNLKNKAGYTSIMLVALAEMRNDTHHYVVQRLFSIGDINIKATQNGQTALMLAVSHGKKDIMKILLDVGAEINLQDKDGSTALMCAAEHGHLEIAKILLSHSECDPTIVDNDGCTALAIAMEAGHKDIGLLIYTNMNFSRGSSPYSTLKTRKRSTPRSTPPPHTPTLRTPPLPSPATKSMNSLTSFHFS